MDSSNKQISVKSHARPKTSNDIESSDENNQNLPLADIAGSRASISPSHKDNGTRLRRDSPTLTVSNHQNIFEQEENPSLHHSKEKLQLW